MSLARLALGAALLASSVQASIFIQAPKNYRSVSYTQLISFSHADSF